MASQSDIYTNFEPPPPAPVFEPTEEEFKDPLGYIAKIKPIAENYGVVKVKAPPSWQPPFVINPDKFQFTPRIQKLNELEATNRVRMNFLNKIINFWHLQGTALKVLLIDNKPVDLFKLHRAVQENGGFDECISSRKWPFIARNLGFRPIQGVLLKSNYEKLLKPYDIYESGKALAHATSPDSKHRPAKPKRDRRMASKERQTKQGEGVTKTRATPRELRNLRIRGLVPKEEEKPKLREKKTKDPMENVFCKVCSNGDAEDKLLLCESCDESFHTYCLLPKLNSVPKGEWRCPKCVTEEVVKKPEEAFGFEQCNRSYTLHSFGEMADDFKREYFGMPCHMVPVSQVERSYWKEIVKQDETVSAMYGADLFTDEVGSGFPRQTDVNLNTLDEPYAKNGWNLNNLPVLKNSFLSHISTDISGMMVPWDYVGMLFSTFCWHTEDHWSYSINYLHWGEPKRWYGVSGNDAGKFEKAFKDTVPELFASQPDLLHHIVTTMNPRILINKGIKIHSVTQEAGDFVITFPRSYHAGFNCGFNFAEAVNFCPADWLSVGRQCIDHYADMRRYCVFAHDELVCSISNVARDLDVPMAVSAYKDMLRMIERERDMRAKMKDMGVAEAKREIFELINDDERQCAYCKTTCYMSAITCGCQADKMVCLNHVNHLCDFCVPSKYCLRFRYTLTELPPLMKGLIERTKCFETWATNVKKTLNMPEDSKPDLDDLKLLCDEAKSERFPVSDTYDALHAAVRHAERCANIAEQLVAHKIKTRTRQHGLTNYSNKLKLEEVEAFWKQIDKLTCRIPQNDAIKEFVNKAQSFKKEAAILLKDLETSSDLEAILNRLRETFDKAVALDLQLPELLQIKKQLDKFQWLCAAEKVAKVDGRKAISVIDNEEEKRVVQVGMDRLKSLITEGLNFPGQPRVETRMARLQYLLSSAQNNEEKAMSLLHSAIKFPLSAAEVLMSELVPLPNVKQPSVEQLKTTILKTKDWIERYDEIMNSNTTLLSLEQLLSSSKAVPFDLESRPNVLRSVTTSLGQLLDKLDEMFLKYPYFHTMVGIVSPRTDLTALLEGQRCPVFPTRRRSRTEEWCTVGEYKDKQQLSESLSKIEDQECKLIERLRVENQQKRQSIGPDSKPKPVCLCRKPPGNDPILPCHLCCDLFHVNCVKWDPILPEMRGRYLCPRCSRSLRPEVKTVEELLDQFTPKIQIDSTEIGLVKYMVKRAKDWQMEAQQFLSGSQVYQLRHLAANQSESLIEAKKTLDSLIVSGLLIEFSLPQMNNLLQLEKNFYELTQTQLSLIDQLKYRPVTPEQMLPPPSEQPKAKSKRSGTGTSGSGLKRQRTVYHEDEQQCSAPNCLRPIGNEVNWVQCESGCENWYHILCVGLTVQSVKKMDSYTCYKCTTTINTDLLSY